MPAKTVFVLPNNKKHHHGCRAGPEAG
ncbi:MAG: hypothetical protein ACLVES_00740 [Faecalibacterium prausnitzii]